MKKLKLKALELGAKEVLSREQLKNVLGGFDDAGGSGSGSGKGSGSGSGKSGCGICQKGSSYETCTASVVMGTNTCKCPNTGAYC